MCVSDRGVPTTASTILARAKAVNRDSSRRLLFTPDWCASSPPALSPKALGGGCGSLPCAPVAALPSFGPYTLGAQGSQRGCVWCLSLWEVVMKGDG